MSLFLLVLRPEPGASATAASATEMGMDVVVRPLFEVRAVDWTPPDAAQFDAVVMTSANAALLGGSGLARYRRLPLYAVGNATAKAARDAGFGEIVAGNGDVAALGARVEADQRQSVLHIGGRDRIVVPAFAFTLNVVAVYASDSLPSPDLPEYGVALLHSQRAARRFAELVPAHSRFHVIAISPAVAEAAGSEWASVATARQPNDASMLELASRLCEMHDR